MNTRVNHTDLKNQPSTHIAMESRSSNQGPIPESSYRPFVVQGQKYDEEQSRYERSFSPSSKKQQASSNGYFSIESMLVLVGLTASLLILPLMLPTLPPPPLMFLVVPVGILALLLVIAFMPYNVRDLTCM